MLERGAALACFLRSHARILTVRSKFVELQRRDMIASSVWSPRTDAHTVASVVLSVCVSRPPALCVLLCMCTDGHEVPHGCGCLGCVSGDVVVTCVAPPVRPVVRRRQALCSCGKWAGS